MPRNGNEFIKITEIIPIHIERYNRQIDRLLAITDYSKEELKLCFIDTREYYRAREQRIRAYSDCINTMIQKERVLQYHNSGFQLEVIDERIEIRQVKTPYDISKLSFDEQVGLLQLMKKAKRDQNFIAPIAIGNAQLEVKQLEEVQEVNEVTNIDLIKHEAPAENTELILPFKIDPVTRLKENLNRLAANRFKEVGGKLDMEEERLIQKQIVKQNRY